MRDARRERRHRTTGPILVVAAGGPPQHCRTEQKRGGAPGPRHRVVPQRQLPRHVHHTRAPQVHQGLARQAAGHVAGGPLPGGGEAARPAARARRQVPRAQEVPVAAHHMGRRAEDALLQGANPQPAARVVPAGPIPEPDQEEGTGPGHRSDAHAGGQLVQEPKTTRQGGSRQEQVRRASRVCNTIFRNRNHSGFHVFFFFFFVRIKYV